MNPLRPTLRTLALTGLFALTLGATAPAQAAEDAAAPLAMRRFALVAGADDGGPDRVLLRYARSDAAAFARVLQELGGVAPADTILLTEPSADGLRAGLAELQRSVAAAQAEGLRLEAVFYFSGHSDEQGLLLAGDRLPYRDIRAAIDAVPADVRIAVLDSCASGAFTREKGGVRRAPFQVDTAAQVRGYAFLTSASADEPAQESDRLGGSFFTHNLVAGLRGAADASRDGRVTLNEAYQYAFHGTLAQTESSFGGAQHPNYDMRLAGSGDVVLTDLRATSALLVLGPDVDGRLYIRDGAGRLAAEIDKPGGRAMSLGLAPGRYTVTVERDGALRRGTVELSEGQPAPLTLAALAPVAGERVALRGGPSEVEGAVAAEDADDLSGYRIYPFNLSFVPGLSLAGVDSTDVVQYFGLHLLGGYAAQLRGAEFGGLLTWEIELVRGAQLAGIANVSGGPVTGAQVAGIGNIAVGDVTGLQVAGIASLSTGFLQGVQFSGVFNLADGGRGAQLGAIANLSTGDLTGAQLGLLNMAAGDVTGAQVGIINYAESVDAPIGILSIVRDGQIHADLWGSDSAAFNAALRIGGRYVYNLFAIGVNPFGSDDRTRWMLGWGIGGHIPLPRGFGLDIDLLGYHINEGGWTRDFHLLTQVRISASYAFAERFRIFAGISYNTLVSAVDDGAAWRIGSVERTRVEEYDLDVVSWPGFFLGIRI